MASDTPGEASVSVNLPESLSRWLDDKAREESRSREDVLLQLLSAYRRIDGLEDGDVDPPAGIGGNGMAGLDEFDELPEGLRQGLDERLEERLEADAVDDETLDRRLGEVESRYVELLEDVRDRIVQVKREADAKAPADHDHPELEGAVADLDGRVANLETAADELASQVDSGFANYEEVLEYLADSIDRVSARQTTLANAIVETHEELRALAARDTARSTAESLKREANQLGVQTADCGECDAPVDVGLLSRSECPHCSSTFVGVDASGGFFGSDTLETGDRPALEAGEPQSAAEADGFEFGVDEILESDDEERPTVGVDDGPPEDAG